jgi:hypothetical protein
VSADSEVYLCDLCHAAIGLRWLDYYWCCSRCAAKHAAQIACEEWNL